VQTKICGGSAPTPPPEIVISGLWIRGSEQTLSEFLPLFLQKESGFQGKALRISTGEKAFCTLFTEERFSKFRGLRGNPRIQTHLQMIIPDESFVIP
jgi:hypothetical protein